MIVAYLDSCELLGRMWEVRDLRHRQPNFDSFASYGIGRIIDLVPNVQVENARFVPGSDVIGLGYKDLVVIGDSYVPYTEPRLEGYEELVYVDGKMYFASDVSLIEEVESVVMIRGKAYAPRRTPKSQLVVAS